MTGDHPDILPVRFGGAESFQTPPRPGSLGQLLLTFGSYRWVDLGTGVATGIARVQAQTCPHNLLRLSKTQEHVKPWWLQITTVVYFAFQAGQGKAGTTLLHISGAQDSNGWG